LTHNNIHGVILIEDGWRQLLF